MDDVKQKFSTTSDADSVVGLYRRHARAWAEDRGTWLSENAWLDHFLKLLPANGNVLDLGCGSAEPIGRYLIERGCAVTGRDSSPGLIAICKERFPSQDWQVGDMRTLSLSRLFNGILAWDSFFHLCHNDQRQMFPAFRNYSAPRAALMFTSGTSHGVAIGAYRGEPLYHASLDNVEYRALLDSNGFEVIAHVEEDPICDRTVWLARLR